MRILNNQTATLTVTFYDDETPVTAGSVTVTVRDASGTTASTGSATAGGSTGVYTYTLPLLTNGKYVVSWVGTRTTTTNLEVVGTRLFTLQELRTSDDMLDDAGRYTTDKLKSVLEGVEDEFEAICNRSFITRRTTAKVDASLEGVGVLPDADIQSIVTVDGNAYGGTTTPYGVVDAVGQGQHTIIYEYGLSTVPADIKRVALIRARQVLAASFTGIPDRATTYSPTDGGTYSLATAGRAGYETGIPEVDAVLTRYSLQALGGQA